MRVITPRASVYTQEPTYWENFLTDEEINYILALPEWVNAKKATVYGQTNDEELNKIRRSEAAWMPFNAHEHIWAKLEMATAEINRQFFGFDLTGFYEPAQLGLYSETDQGHYGWHVDSSHTISYTPRKLSMALLLDDPSTFEGGELQVKSNGDTPISLEQQRGRAWFFPSYMLHQVTPVTKGVRRSLVLWVGGPSFK